MFKSTVGALVFLLAAVSAAPHQDGDLPPPRSVIKQAFYIFPPPPKGGGAVAGGRGRFGCDNPHPYCKKDNHPKEACTDWGEGWKGWMKTARRNVENVVAVVVDHLPLGHQDVVDLDAIIHILTVRRTTTQRKHVQTGERDGKDGWKRTARRNVENVVAVVVDHLPHLGHLVLVERNRRGAFLVGSTKLLKQLRQFGRFLKVIKIKMIKKKREPESQLIMAQMIMTMMTTMTTTMMTTTMM